LWPSIVCKAAAARRSYCLSRAVGNDEYAVLKDGLTSVAGVADDAEEEEPEDGLALGRPARPSRSRDGERISRGAVSTRLGEPRPMMRAASWLRSCTRRTCGARYVGPIINL